MALTQGVANTVCKEPKGNILLCWPHAVPVTQFVFVFFYKTLNIKIILGSQVIF